MDSDYLEMLRLLEEEGVTDLASLVEEKARDYHDLAGILLGILYDSQSEDNWDKLVETLTDWDKPEEIPAVLNRIKPALDAWPDHLRTVTEDWWNEAQNETELPPTWPIVRALIVNELNHGYQSCTNLSTLSSFKVMDVQNDFLPLEDLKYATSLEQLRYVFAIDDSLVKQEQLEYIGALHSLKALTLTLTESEDLSFLNGLTELRSLSLTLAIRKDYKLDLSVLTKLKQLESLELLNEFEPFPSLEPLTALSKLKKLKIKRPPDDLHPLSSLSQLSELELSNVSRWTEDKEFYLPSSLTTVHLHDVQGISSLESLKYANGLNSLRIFRAPHLTDITAIGEFPQLQDLLLENTGIATISELDQNTDLKELRLHSNPYLATIQSHKQQNSLHHLVVTRSPALTDLSGVAHMIGIRRLLLNQLDDLSDLSPLAALTSLEELILERCPKITSLTPIANLNNLRRVYISQCPRLTDEKIIGKLDNARFYIS